MSTPPVEYTVTPLAPVTLGKTAYQVERQDFANGGESVVFFTGPRGGVYMMQPPNETGVSCLVAFMSGSPQPMRKHGNVVRLVSIGNIIEELKG